MVRQYPQLFKQNFNILDLNLILLFKQQELLTLMIQIELKILQNIIEKVKIYLLKLHSKNLKLILNTEIVQCWKMNKE